MSQRFYYWDPDNETVELENGVQAFKLELATNAEEGSRGSCSVIVDDPSGTFYVRGHRRFWVVETDAEEDDFAGVIYVGYTAERVISRGEDSSAEQVGDGRSWNIKLVDQNVLLSNRINVGNDCDRPAETDLERIAWLLQTSELNPIDQTDSTYIDSTGGVAMDAVDYTGQTVLDVLDDCAQQSGREYFLFWLDREDGVGTAPFRLVLWYKFAASTDFASAVKISNVDADVNDSTVYAPSQDTTLSRNPDLVYSGVFQQYDPGDGSTGWVYVTNPTTVTRFIARDTHGRAENVKSRAKALSRANRYLADIDTETDTISTAIEVAAADVNSVMAGHRIEVKFQHLPDYSAGYNWMRVKERTVRHIGLDRYELALTLVGPAPSDVAVVGAPGAGTCSNLTPAGTYYPLGAVSGTANPSDGVVYYLRAGIGFPIEPTVGHQGHWHFAVYGVGGSGTTDYWGDCTTSTLRLMVGGDGTMTINLAEYAGNARTVSVRLMHHQYGPGPIGPTSGVDVLDQVWTHQTVGTPIEVPVSTHNGQNCTHWVDVRDDGPACGAKVGFESMEWVPT